MALRIDTGASAGIGRAVLLLDRLLGSGVTVVDGMPQACEIGHPMEAGIDPAVTGRVDGRGAQGPGASHRHYEQGEKGYDDENQADAGNAGHGNHLLSIETRLQAGVLRWNPRRLRHSKDTALFKLVCHPGKT
jgi:hypothetical protein